MKTSARSAVAALAVLLVGVTLGAGAPAASGTSSLPTLAPTCSLPEPLCDHTAPRTRLDSTPPVDGSGRTPSRDAAFTFSTDPAEPGATFVCKLTRDGAVVHDFVDCTTNPPPSNGTSTGARGYTGLPDGNYAFAVHATDGSLNHNTGPDTVFQWAVGNPPPPPADTQAPETEIAEAPRNWNLQSFAYYRYTSPDAVASWACTLDGADKNCGANGNRFIQGLKAGTHEFRVSAVDQAGNADPSPATDSFTIPLNSRKLEDYSRGWSNDYCQGCFLDRVSTTTRKGAWITQGTKGLRKLALVVTKGPGYGTVKVYLGKVKLRKISLANDSLRHRRLVMVKKWDTLKSGRIRIEVTSSGKTVAIEGIGMAKK